MHRALGPGLLQSVYEVRPLHELNKRGLKAERQVLLPVVYDGLRLDDRSIKRRIPPNVLYLPALRPGDLRPVQGQKPLNL